MSENNDNIPEVTLDSVELYDGDNTDEVLTEVEDQVVETVNDNDGKELFRIPVVGKFEKVTFGEYSTFIKPAIIESIKSSSKEKVSFDEKAIDEEIKSMYDAIIIPTKDSDNSPIYRFLFPSQEATLSPGQSLIIPTGIRVKTNPGWVLLLLNNRESADTFRLQLDCNTCVVADENQIVLKITNDNKDNQSVIIKYGNIVCDSVFVPFGYATNDFEEKENEEDPQ